MQKAWIEAVLEEVEIHLFEKISGISVCSVNFNKATIVLSEDFFHVNIHCLLQHSCAPIMAVTNQGGISYAE